MWFTRVSLQNPVFATMVMLAIVVLGLFSYQRLQVDQFPNIDLPVVVIITDYPGAAPEVIESEVSKKIEEAVNSVAGIEVVDGERLQAVGKAFSEQVELDNDGDCSLSLSFEWPLLSCSSLLPIRLPHVRKPASHRT